MAQNSWTPEDGGPLPQYGFGSDLSFDSLVKQNPFLFRVHTPKERSPFFDNTEPYFVGQRFNERYVISPQKLSESSSSQRPIVSSTYADAERHMNFETRCTSAYISTSFSFIWAIWEAVRRYRLNMKHDVEIAVIDARALTGRAVTTVELLRLSTEKERNRDYWKWYRFALESQGVLVYESIPGSAVLTSVQLIPLLEKLPAYFLQNAPHHKASPFDRLAWDFLDPKPSFRHFCQDMSEKFLRLPIEIRLRDATAGSVRLAVALLRPWFHKMLSDDCDSATATAFELSCIIAKWPAQWWTRDHTEMWDVIRDTVKVVVEELREKEKVKVVGEGSRVEEKVGNLDHETQAVSSPITPPASAPASPLIKAARRTISSLSIRTQSSSHSVESATETVCDDALPTPPASPTELTWSKGKSVRFISPTKTTFEPPVELDRVPSPPVWSIIQPPSSRSTSKPKSSDTPPSDVVKPHSMAETASCIVTGFLFGAYIALGILASQRRPLALYLT